MSILKALEQKFDSMKVEVTQEDVDYFRNTYQIDLFCESAFVIEILVNFRRHGASAAIMNLIYKLTQKEN